MPSKHGNALIGKSLTAKARDAEIVIQEVDNELLVYDLKNNKAHHLNKTSSLVWQNCDGKNTFDEVAEVLEKELGSKVEADFIWLALEELEKHDLLENSTANENFDGLTRRDVLFRYALPSIILPAIVSLSSPKAVQAQSCIALLDACDPNNDNCCMGLFCSCGAAGTGTCQNIPT